MVKGNRGIRRPNKESDNVTEVNGVSRKESAKQKRLEKAIETATAVQT